MDKEMKIELSMGCTEFLIEEVEKTRRQNELLSAENRVMNNFFSLVSRIGEKPSVGYGPDQLWQAKKEIEQAVSKAMLADKPMVKGI